MLGFLRNETFQLFLDQLSVVSSAKGVAQLPAAELTQLYQALDSIQPSATAEAKQQRPWLRLRAQLATLGLRPPPTSGLSFTTKLCVVLRADDLSHRAKVRKGSYLVDAVLLPPDNTLPEILLSIGMPDYFKNVTDR